MPIHSAQAAQDALVEQWGADEPVWMLNIWKLTPGGAPLLRDYIQALARDSSNASSCVFCCLEMRTVIGATEWDACAIMSYPSVALYREASRARCAHMPTRHPGRRAPPDTTGRQAAGAHSRVPTVVPLSQSILYTMHTPVAVASLRSHVSALLCPR